MRGALYTLMTSVTLLAACAGVQKEPQPLFDSRSGIAGGNEFNARAQQGPDDHYAAFGDTRSGGEKAAAPVTAAPAPQAPVPAPNPAPVSAPVLAAAPAVPAIGTATSTASAAAQAVRIDIDANAYGAVFGTAPAPVKPTPAQLMQLDSLSLMAAEALRVDLQTRILQCRRAGEACRLGAR